MPPNRRKPSASTARAQQTLAFGPTTNKVTKPSSLSTTTSGKNKTAPSDSERLQKAVADLSTPSPVPAEEEEYPPRPEAQLESPSRTLALRGQEGAAAISTAGRGEEDAVTKKEKEKSEAEEKGSKVSEAQVKRYWKGKEDERIAPRVHQRGLGVNEKILRHFDLSSQYGVSAAPHPCPFVQLALDATTSFGSELRLNC